LCAQCTRNWYADIVFTEQWCSLQEAEWALRYVEVVQRGRGRSEEEWADYRYLWEVRESAREEVDSAARTWLYNKIADENARFTEAVMRGMKGHDDASQGSREEDSREENGQGGGASEVREGRPGQRECPQCRPARMEADWTEGEG